MTQAVSTLTVRDERRREEEAQEQPLRDVLVELWENSQKLVQKEFELASVELEKRVAQAKKDAAAAATGGAVLYGGVLCLHAALILLLSKVMDPWVAALIVGAAAAAAGGALLMKARKDVQTAAFAPKRTARTIRDDIDMIKEAKQ